MALLDMGVRQRPCLAVLIPSSACLFSPLSSSSDIETGIDRVQSEFHCRNSNSIPFSGEASEHGKTRKLSFRQLLNIVFAWCRRSFFCLWLLPHHKGLGKLSTLMSSPNWTILSNMPFWLSFFGGNPFVEALSAGTVSLSSTALSLNRKRNRFATAAS